VYVLCTISAKILKYNVGVGDGKGKLVEGYCDKYFERWVEKRQGVYKTPMTSLSAFILWNHVGTNNPSAYRWRH
jgi:hypothetical protein